MSEDAIQDFVFIPQSQLQTLQTELDRLRNADNEPKEGKEAQGVTNLDQNLKEQHFEQSEENGAQQFEEATEKEDDNMSKESMAETATVPEVPEVAEIKIAKSNRNLVKGKNLNRQCHSRRLKAQLRDTGVELPKNTNALVNAAVGQTKKPLSNEPEFYQIILDHNLIDLVTNPHKFVAYIKPSLFKI